MTLNKLKEAAQSYLSGSMVEATFYCAIIEYLETATPDDYAAFAMWLSEAKEVH